MTQRAEPAVGVPAATSTLADFAAPPRSLWGDAFHRLSGNRLALVGASILGIITVLAIFAPLVAPYGYQEVFSGSTIADPSWKHPFGTNLSSQDTLSRVIFGARNSLGVGVLVQGIILVIAAVVGGASALGARWMDALLMRMTDVVYAFPDLLFVILLQQVLSGTALAGYMGGLFVVFFAIVLALALLLLHVRERTKWNA